jgi:sigma-B regulation protein RsbU (phosphoserine phosphatase)
MVAREMKKRRKSPRTQSPNLLRGLLALYFLASIGYLIAGAVDVWEVDLHWDRHIQSPLSYDSDTILVTEVQPEAKAAGLAMCMKITGLNGAPYSGIGQWAEILVTANPGDTLDVEFDRPNGTHGISTLTLTQRKRAHPGISNAAVLVRDGFIDLLLPLVCLFIGYWVVLMKPLDRNAWLLLILLTFPSVLTTDVGMATGAAMLMRGFWYQTLQLFASPALLLFGVYFPERSRIDQKIPWLKWLIIGPILAFAAYLYPYLIRIYFLGGATLA